MRFKNDIGQMKVTVDPAFLPTSEDRLLGGAIALRQPASGHRAGTDAVLLAAACPPKARHLADLGAASGAVGLMAALRVPQAQVTLLEKDTALVALARENIAANALEARVDAREADAFKLSAQPELREAFNVVLTNPPFFTPGATRVSPHAGRARAHHLEGDLHRWVSGMLTILKPKGEAVMIHRADHVESVLAACSGRLGAMTLRFIHPRAGEAASRLLIAGIKGSRAPLAVLAPLVLHAGAGFTEEVAALHAGHGHLSTRA